MVILAITVEPPYNGHFGTRYFWPLFATIRFSSSEVKNVLVKPIETKIFVLIIEILSIVSLIRRVY